MTISSMAAAVLTAGCLLLAAQPSRAQDVAAGERLFKQRCAACHTVQPGQNRIGPHLSGIVGRKPGSVEGARYSKTMSSHAPDWDPANLDSYLANPRGVVPGTTMTIAVPNAADRGNIIAYLQGLPKTN